MTAAVVSAVRTSTLWGITTIGGVVVGVTINRRLADCGVVAGAVMVSKGVFVRVVVVMSSTSTFLFG